MALTGQHLARRRLIANACLAAFAFCCVALVVWPPESTGWYPVCPFAAYLHVLCPGCGMTRAVAALLRGQWQTALLSNPLCVALLPVLLGAAGETYRRAVAAEEFRWPQVPPVAGWAALAVAAAFTFLRNAYAAGR